MQDIPTIDIAGDFENTIQEVDDACREIGFMCIRGHGISIDTVTRVRNAVIEYFNRPLSEKLRDRISRDNYRGYIPQGFFSANSEDLDADRYEGCKLHFEVSADDPICAECDLYGPNKWPDGPAGFRETILDYWGDVSREVWRTNWPDATPAKSHFDLGTLQD